MECSYFGACGSCTLYDLNYEEQLAQKVKETNTLLDLKNPTIIRSNPIHFRNRAEFKIWHTGSNISYAMSRLDKKGVVEIDECKIVSRSIYKLMPKLIKKIESIRILEHKLFAIEFISSTTSNIIVTLIYHKPIDNSWGKVAKELEDEFDIKVIGRSRGKKIVVSDEFIDEELTIKGEKFHFRLYDSGFIQPNLKVNEKMIEWVLDQTPTQQSDLLELYCGHGNFTIPLSQKFDRVLATEVSKSSIRSAKENCKLNSIENIDFVRLSSEELVSALNKDREFKRLKGISLDSYNFSHIFVDPPRAGLDGKSLEFISQFDNIIYISCNPTTLKRDLDRLKDRFKIKKFAIFDQFAYTNHLECGVVLKK